MDNIQYETKLESTALLAIKTLNSMILPDNPAVIFDIDDTLIDRNGKCIIPIISVYNHVKMMGINPIIITSRCNSPYNVFEYTPLQLETCGITGIHSLYFRPDNELNQYIYKLNARKDVNKRGLTVIMSIGDMPWDVGEYGGFPIIVPRKFSV